MTLTAQDHTRIRQHLALIPAYLWLVYSWKDLLLHLPLGFRGSQGRYARDFVQFYLQGVIANHHDASALYDIARWNAMLPVVAPASPDLRYPPVYGPQVSALFSPLARLPYASALMIWLAVSLIAYVACVYAIWRTCPRLHDRPAMVALLALGYPGLYYTLHFTQISAIALVCATAAFLALRANRPFLAGLAIGTLIYKPQLGLAAAVTFVLAREWRIVAGAIVAGAAQLAAGCAFWGISILPAYLRSLVAVAPRYSAEFEPFKFHMHSWRSFFELLGMRTDIATAAYAVCAIATLVVAFRCWRGNNPLAVRFAVLLIATLLVNPHMYVYDFLILTPAFLLLWNWVLDDGPQKAGDVFGLRRSQRLSPARIQWLMYVCYLSPLFAIVALVARVQLSVPAFAWLLTTCYTAGRAPGQRVWNAAKSVTVIENA